MHHPWRAEEAAETLRPTAKARRVRLRQAIEDGTRRLYVDPDWILRVLGNYLDNALKVRLAGSEIALRVQPYSSENGIRFSVRDHGKGMPPESLSHAFDRYWLDRSTAHNGAGLGLTIA